MKNKKGFTLTELLAVIVVVGILLTLATVSVLRYVEESRKKAFVEDARTIIHSTRENFLSGKYEQLNNVVVGNDGVSYAFQAVQSTLDKKLGMGPFNSKYKDAGTVIVRDEDSGETKYKYYACLIDEDGNGFDYTPFEEINTGTIDTDVEGLTKCNINLVPIESNIVIPDECVDCEPSITEPEPTPVDPSPEKYIVKYDEGITDSTIANMPDDQTVNKGTNAVLSSKIPTSSKYAFLGWATKKGADVNDTWYDPSDTYKGNTSIVLYAQWYNITELEKKYSTYVQLNDIMNKANNDRCVNDKYVFGGKNYIQRYYTFLYQEYRNDPPVETDYKPISISGFSAPISNSRVFRVNEEKSFERPMSTSYTNEYGCPTRQYLYVKVRDQLTDSALATLQTTKTVPQRIVRLQQIQDTTVKLSEIRGKTLVQDNISVKAKETKSGSISLPASDSNWKIISVGGHNIANASSDGGYTSRCSLTKLAVNGGKAALDYKIMNSSPSDNAKVKISAYAIELVKSKTPVTKYSDPTSGPKGPARLAILRSIANDMKNYFTYNHFRYKSVISGKMTVKGETSGWGTSGKFEKAVSVQDGKLLGVSEYGVENATNENYYCSYSVINKAYLPGFNTQKGTATVVFYGGNQNFNSNKGKDMIDVDAYARVIYISSKALVIG